MSEKEYIKNRAEVFEIYGINPKDKSYNCHHIVNRHDVGTLVGIDFPINGKANLAPIKIREHRELHEKQAMLEGYPIFHKEKKKKKKKKKYRNKHRH